MFLTFVWWRPVSQEQQWNRIVGNCSKSACLYNLTQDTAQNIDVAFIGTSRTMNAVNDSALSKAWHRRVVNLGYCRPGRNMHLEIFKLLLKKNHPAIVFIELNQEEDWYGHFDFGNVATTKEVFYSLQSKNPKFLRDVKQNFIMKYDLFQNNIKDQAYPGEFCFWGFGNILQRGKNLTAVSFADTNTANQRFTSNFYLEQIIQLATKHNIRLFFHYLPAYGLIEYQPHQLQFYQKYGEVVMPPHALENEKFWSDNSHLTLDGAILYSQFLQDTVSADLLK